MLIKQTEINGKPCQIAELEAVDELEVQAHIEAHIFRIGKLLGLSCDPLGTIDNIQLYLAGLKAETASERLWPN